METIMDTQIANATGELQRRLMSQTQNEPHAPQNDNRPGLSGGATTMIVINTLGTPS
jgi:hypothetical protein